jgi:beta-1,4-mannosyl-glycoprotein beta-1,4-N-acetylglucosaminyltransferase
MIYDIFSFNNELDMLELRLNILDPHVDKFVLVEADKTFSGVNKPLYYEENKERFVKFYDKIIHYKVLDSPTSFDDPNCDQEILQMALNSDNVTRDHICWLIEFYQKESIKKALEPLNIHDYEMCVVSDVDEIWNYNLKFNFWMPQGAIYKPKINNCYIEYLNVKTNEDWTYFTGPIVCEYFRIKNGCLNHLRTQRKMNHIYTFLEDGGWHFNALGGSDKKIQDFQHPVYHKDYMERRKSGWRVDETGLPQYILDNKEELKKKGLFL